MSFGERRQRFGLDRILAGGGDPAPYPPGFLARMRERARQEQEANPPQRKEKFMPQMATRPSRPARPTVIDPETLADGVKTFGSKPREIANLEYIPAGLVMTDLNGNRMIHVRKADALGRTGVMWFATPGHEAPASLGMPIYADPNDPTRTVGHTSGEPWTAEDLLYAANKLVHLPGHTNLRAWVNEAEDHVERAQRACRVLVHLAARAGSLQGAAEATADGHDLVAMITGANLLGQGEVERLIMWRGPIPGVEDRHGRGGHAA